MLRAGLNASSLYSKNGLVCSFSSKERIGTESFPIPSALWNSADIHHGAQNNIDTFATVFHTYVVTTQTNHLAIKAGPLVNNWYRTWKFFIRRSSINSSGESSYTVCRADTQGRILGRLLGQIHFDNIQLTSRQRPGQPAPLAS